MHLRPFASIFEDFSSNYLKHNTRMAFPSVLIFHDVPESIDYEMTSKHSPDVIKGKIEIA